MRATLRWHPVRPPVAIWSSRRPSVGQNVHVHLDRLLADPSLDLTLRTPDGPSSASIGWVHTSELADPRPWLEGGEFLLTTGLNLPESPQGVAAYVRRLASAGIAALGFGIGPIHDEVPDALVRASARWRLPLVEVPRTTPFIAVSRAVGRWWADRQTRDLQQAMEVQRQLAQAALSDDPVQDLLDRLSVNLGCWALLGDGRSTPRSAGEVPPEGRAWLAGLTGDPARIRTRSTRLGAQPVLVHRVPVRATSWALAVGRDAAFSTVERSLVLLGQGLLSVVLSPRRDEPDPVVGEVAVGLLAEGRLDLGWQLVRSLLRRPARDQWCIVAARAPAGARDGATPRTARVLGAAREGRHLLLAPAELRGEVVADLVAAGFRCGYSADVRPGDVGRAFEQADRALQVAALRPGGSPGAVGPDDVAPGQLLQLAQPDQVAAAADLLAPLRHDPRGPVLLHTAVTWLEANGHWDNAAAALGLHRHTVRQRVDRAFELLGMDLTRPDDRFEVWLALRLTQGAAGPA
jgi:purine catabolism regulator